jgi:hypothetical protein
MDEERQERSRNRGGVYGTMSRSDIAELGAQVKNVRACEGAKGSQMANHLKRDKARAGHLLLDRRLQCPIFAGDYRCPSGTNHSIDEAGWGCRDSSVCLLQLCADSPEREGYPGPGGWRYDAPVDFERIDGLRASQFKLEHYPVLRCLARHRPFS